MDWEYFLAIQRPLPCHIIPRSTLRGWIITLMVQGEPRMSPRILIDLTIQAMKEQDQSRRTSIMSIGDTATLRRCGCQNVSGDTVTLAHTPQPKPLLIRQKPAKHTERDRQTGPSKALNLTIEPTNRERRTLNFGRIQKLVREVYLRDDIYCGALFCKSCEDKSKARSTILVLDTNVVLNQIDLLENPAIEDVVLLSVVLQETMAGESPNDRNDRAIRVAARWYQSHLGEAVKIDTETHDPLDIGMLPKQKVCIRFEKQTKWLRSLCQCSVAEKNSRVFTIETYQQYKWSLLNE
uniref:PIN domain-containing protein n=1 Tax=Salix viminalis TaxID=40686 RepID=A0A6N2MPV6_SALVM